VKILCFYQYFSTSKGSWGTRVYDFASNWVKQGHEVTVITSTFAKSDVTTEKFLDVKIYDGIKVNIINVKIDNRQNKLKRIWTWLIYMFFACLYAITIPTDIVIASSGPITVGIPGLVARYIRRRKLIFEVRDLWPRGAIEMELVTNKLLIKFLYWFEKYCYMASSYIVALSPGMADDILRRYPDRKVISITNSADICLFSNPSVFDIGNYKYQKYAIYTGNIGKTNNSLWLYDAAKILKQWGRNDIHILMIGEGQERKILQSKKDEEHIDNLILLDLMPKTKMAAYLQNALVSLVPLKGVPVLDSSSPNKFFESLAAGIPVIQNTNGWIKDFIEDNKIGFTLDPDDPEALARLLIEIADGNIDITRMGIRAKKIAEEQFNKDYLSDKYLSILTG